MGRGRGGRGGGGGAVCAGVLRPCRSSNFANSDGHYAHGTLHCASAYDDYFKCVKNPHDFQGINCGYYEETLIKMCGGVAEAAKCVGPEARNDICGAGGPFDCRALRGLFDECVEDRGSGELCPFNKLLLRLSKCKE